MKKSLDKHYLSLQFQNKIFSKDGDEFQSFFENIMEKAFSDFKKIRPFGNQGDGGNDGYRESLGIYYQVYAPLVPKVNEREAGEKFERDFQKLKNEWDKISEVKEYNFVFNDKYLGSVQLLEERKAQLKTNNPSIEFKLFLAKDLENLFFQLSESDILGLGFNIDHRQAFTNAKTYLENVKTELDRENPIFAQKLLENVKEIITELGDEDLILEYEILECRCLQKLEKIDEVKEKYENISKRYPKDSRPFLYLAEICLGENDFDKNDYFIKQAERIDSDFWLLRLQQILRKQNLGASIDISLIDERTFTDVPEIKSNFYRLYGLLLENSADEQNADRFVATAIRLNPNNFNAYFDELALIERRMFASQDISQKLSLSQLLLDKIEIVTSKFEYIRDRNKLNLNIKKFNALFAQENTHELVNVAMEIFLLVFNCYLNKRIQQMIAGVFKFVSLPTSDLNQLLEYLKNSKKFLIDELSDTLIFQFAIRDALFTSGKNFFKDTNNQKYYQLIVDLEIENDETVLNFLNQNISLAITLAGNLRNPPGLRRKILENLPDDKNIQKDKLRLLLNFEEKDFDEAFQILKELDLSNLEYFECLPMLIVAEQKEAWDFVIIILQKLLEKEKDKKELLNLKLRLFSSYINSEKYPDAIKIGEELLNEDASENFLSTKNREALLVNIVNACIERGKVDKEALGRAKLLVKTYQLPNPSFEFKTGVEAELYLNNHEAENALEAVIEGVKIRKILSPQEYARLYFLFVRIGNQIERLNIISLENVQENTFVKLKDHDQWYFIGANHELDTLLINKTNNKYALFINQKIGADIVFENRYSSESQNNQIELIFPIEKYILWKVVENFQKLAKVGDLEGVQVIEIPQKDNTIDPQNLLKFFEDLNTKAEPLFELYCKNTVPLAMLAISEGGLADALGKIQQEGKGFVNFSDGTNTEFIKQKEIARKVIDEKMPFYIDGTSAVFLSEIGILQKIYPYITNLKIPQSVINLLADITGKFQFIPGQTGDRMGYAKGQIFLSSIEKDKQELLSSRFIDSIRLFESNPKNISIISSANKIDCLSEKQCPPELCDACILAQRENLPVMTEDFLYLKLNEYETTKKAPEYFSSLALVRVCYEKGYITFDEYLDYFGYLSSYRFRFLHLTSDDIGKAVFTEKGIVKPENIRRLNLSFTLSEEYGVLLQNAIQVVGTFFFKTLMDDTVNLDFTEQIFVEIVKTFPPNVNKKEFAERLIGACITIFENNISKSKTVCRLEDKTKHQKIEKLLQLIESFGTDSMPLDPN